uniref:HYDIN axonemal central pair apparatus protein n=1 Tax=Scophthalmus maximus TaxID=52904 RepID=A0A8D3BS88_SCOMX
MNMIFLAWQMRPETDNNTFKPLIISSLIFCRQSVYCLLRSLTLCQSHQTLFQPNPSELVFQNFTHTQTHKLPVVFVNNDKVSRHVKMELKHSEYFHVVGPEDAVSKVAPGLCATFPVVFTPTENKDYFHKLVFVTDQDRFEVPVRAIGPRAILDFPDELRLPLCPVKASTEKTHFVRNVGNSKANFTLHTQRPFSVTPAFGTLDIGVGMQVTVSFNPMTTGDQSQDLLLHYHTGEDVHVRLHGACEELNVHLEPDSVTLEKTYISLSSVHKLSLTNSTDIPLRYRWSAWPGQEEEDLSLLRYSVLQQKEEEERERLLFQCESDPTAIHRLPLLTRALQECRSRAARDRLVALSDSCITVEPAEGEIWPRTTALFYIVFKPEEAKLHQQTMYCDVTGRNSRLPLTITGEGLGPKLQLDYDLTYMQNVFIGDKECCEVLASNKGLIDAPFRLSRPDTALGRCFSFSPEEGVVPTGACQIVEVTFHSRILGTFSEDLLLTVTGQPEPLTLTFSGCVIGPTFHFSVPELSFGDVAFGFPETLACTLFNTSLVPMTFALRVLGDGLGPPSVTSDRQVSEVTRSNWHGSAARDIRARPAEFYVSPAAGSLRCMSDVVIKVTLCSNTVKSYSLGLVVDVEGVGEKIAILPISARCVVPRIVVETPVLDFQRCFLNYPYEQEVQLTNPSPLPVCYGVLDQECEEAPLLLFGSSVPRGVILPHTSEKIPVFLRAKAVGELHHILPLATFGSEVILTCVGQGPVVHVQNPQLDFGKIPVLTDITRTLRLSNHSPIPANFATRTSHRKSFWRVEPSEGEVPPESQLELRVVAHLRDTIDFRDKLEVSVRDSRTHTVQLSATGTGTTIVSDRPFAPKLDLGTHLSHETYQYRFQLSNHGQQIHRLYWATDGFPACTKTRKRDNSPGVTFLPPINAHRKKEVQSRGSVLSSSREKPVFSLTPSRLELWPGCSVDMVLTGSSDSPKVVRERLVCRGFVGNQDSYKLIMSVDVACRFVAPVLSISAKQLNYYIENVESLTPLYQKLVLKNVSALSLSMTLALVEPFSLCEARGAQSSATTKVNILHLLSHTDLWVCYHPEYCQDWVSRVVDEVTYLEVQYQGHPQQDRVALHAEVHFPNLHFSTTSVDFGCVRNYTETHRTVTITNCSPLPVSYRWAFVEEQGHSDVRYVWYSKKTPLFYQFTSILVYMLYTNLRHYQGREQCCRLTVSLFFFQLFDHMGKAEVTLRNTGKVGFKFTITYPQREEEEEEKEKEAEGLKEGYVDAGAEQCLRVLYLPGCPEVFEKQLQLQVAYLPPEDITVTGQGVFPRISLNLPRNLCMHRHAESFTEQSLSPFSNFFFLVRCHQNEELLHMEIERVLVKENALAANASSLELRDSEISFRKCYKLSKLLLPEYVLDFGYVIHSKVPSHTVNVTNTGSVPVSLHANVKPLAGKGFSAEFERVKNLPCGETQTFTVKFDPQGAKLPTGDIRAVMTIQVADGPTVQVRLCAVVTVPAITVPMETLQFDTVQCGMCQMKTIPLLNRESVPCHWSITEEVKSTSSCLFISVKKSCRSSDRLWWCSRRFPRPGVLAPGKRVHVQIKFSPAEGVWGLPVFITAQGQGEEPQLKFCPSVLELGPCLPVSTGVEAAVAVVNPCPFPVEFYSLEFDTQYLNEEKILRLVQGYDDNNVLLLPPRFPGGSLPRELLDYYKEHCSQQKDEGSSSHFEFTYLHTQSQARLKKIKFEVKKNFNQLMTLSLHRLFFVRSVIQRPTEVNGEMLGQLEMTPVSRAIARHMCVDLSPEGQAAHNRRGIAVIVYGAPLTGKSSTAAALAHHYGGACLSVDAVVTYVLVNGTSPVSLTLTDCHRGVVIDGLTSVYTQSAATTLQIVLRALKKRKHIYVVNLSDSFDAMMALTKFRWVVPANGEVLVKIWFYSDVLGKFEQTLNFELLGTQRRYQLFCRGICAYPSISKDHRILFPRSKKVQKVEDRLQKTYVVKPGYFEFGPLLCSKTRDRYKENRYPENRETLVIHNNSGLEAEVQFTFQHDKQATTFILDPPTMTLKPDQKQELTVWAYPTRVEHVEDSVVCSIRDNPELVLVNLSCWGVRPELELETRHLHFDRVLLHRRDSRTVTLHNKTVLPVSWRLQGLEELGDEFSVPQDQGIISPNSSFILSLHFRARKPLHIKKKLRLEVSDVEDILGIVHTDYIQVSAEAYDIALDISPGKNNGCLDFGTIKVFEEARLSLRMKNQGKYEIAYKFTFEQTQPNQPNLDSMFVLSPQSGILRPHEKPTTVKIVCTPKTAVSIGEQPIMPCQVIEPNIGNGGETIAILTIKVSVHAVFSRYKITPVCDINFGPLVFGSKRSQSFTIENNGFFEFRYSICNMVAETALIGSGASHKGRRESVQRDNHANRLSLGIFSVAPCLGTLQPGTQQVVTVECAAEQLGCCNQGLLIDISDRDPSDHPEGVPYKLLAEVCSDWILLQSLEHHLCPSSEQLSSEQFRNAEGIYVLDDNQFVFHKVLVGRTAHARFKLTNSSKVHCVLCLAIRYGNAKMVRNMEVFHLSATTLNIPSQSHAFAVVTFTPQSMQQYGAVFEAAIEGANRMTATSKTKVLEFELMGEGNLPSVCVLRPAPRNGSGSPVFRFRRVLVGRRHTLPLVLLNDGNVPAQVRPVTRCPFYFNTNPGHQTLVEFEVSFYSDGPVSAEAEMMLQVEDNQHSDTVIPLTGETYWEIVSLDNVRRLILSLTGYCEVLDFGDCHVDCPYQESFTMTNHSSSTAVRFEWPPAGPQVVFSPQVGHLHAGCSKEVTVTFSSNQPVTLNNQPMRCEVHKVKFEQPVEQVMDWDDRQRTVQWLTPATQQESGTQPQQPVKNKVTETEPRCSVVEGSHWGLELRVSTVCDYVKFTYHVCLSVTGESSVSRPGSRSVGGASTAARPSSAVSSVMSVLTRSRELPPFSVEPEFGTIEPGSTQDFSVRFSPLEAAQLQGSIPNLQYGNQAPCISVCGLSLQPHCHFDLEDSDYVSGSRRNPEFREPLDPDVRIIEFNAIGLSATFAVVNPTSAPYSFKWKCEDADGSPFHCLTPCGDIPPGRKVEMCFEYVAKQLDAVESFWSFAIETLSLSFPFLCAGNTREPVVYLSRPHLELGELLVGLKAEHAVYLINGEEDPLYFTVLQSSLVCDDQESSLVLEPASGSVSPKDRLRLALSFTPCREGYVSFRLVLKVKRKSEPLALTVKADCFSLSTLLGVSEQGTVNILVSNLARFSLEVNFDLTGPSELLQHLEAKPQHATVEVGEQLQSLLVFCPQVKCNLHDVRLSVKHGPTFTFAVKGTAVAPSVELSFTKFNFGKCFLFSPGLVSPSQTLVISNKGEVETSVQCQFKSTSYLETRFQPDVLSPGDAMDVPVTFRPREACRYHEKLTFVFNGCVTKHVDILGQGIELKLDVEDPKQRKLKLGHVTLGQKVKKQVVLVNRSLSGVSFTLLLSTDTPLDMMVGNTHTHTHTHSYTYRCGGSCHVEIQFSPRQHIPPFNAELLAECSGLLHPLLTVQGCCQVARCISLLDLNQLAFGAVVQHCQARKRIVMTNTGDMGARFHWKTKSFPPELSISPGKGFIPPGMEVPFDVTFAPKQLSNDKRYDDLTCIVENFSSPVTFTATGSCTAASTSKEVLNFVCPVRGSHSQTLKLANPTNQRCSIRPVLEGEQWRAAPSVTLEALQQKTYEITYRPLTMAANGKKHLGSVFFSFPDGTATLYYLQGTADPPKVEDTLVRELPAKTEHTELLPVKNWLSKQQRFRVLIEILKPGKPDATVSLKGQEYIDVPALAKRNYKMSYFTYREGQHNTKVTFRNEATDEYLFYIVTFKATPPGVLATIELVTTVRRTTSATVQVENPLTTNESKCADINAPPQHTVPPQSKDSLSFQYQPLRAGVSTARLTLCSADLGYFHYDLILRALPPPPEKTVSFNTSLGSSHSVLVKFTNYCRFKTDYACKIDCPDFAVGKLIVAPPGPLTGCEANFEVCFEPHQVGEVRGQLSLSSGLGGEYVFPLHGICLPAKAQGPFTVTAGRIAAIPFKNVFLQTVAFSFQVDNPCFTVKGVDSLPSKKTHNTLVSFVAPAGGQPGPWLGKLTISSQRAEGHSNPCSWVFYLKGVRPDSA